MKKRTIIALFLMIVFTRAFAGEMLLTLDEYLDSVGIPKDKNAGHINLTPEYDEKATYFVDLLNDNPRVEKIAEIGFCLGHSSEVFLCARPNTKVTSFDLMTHWYCDEGKKYIDMKHPGRHKLFKGDSLVTVPAYTKANKGIIFDLILIDGGHQYEVALGDIINMQYLAGPDTIVIMDDTDYGPVARAWKECVAKGLVEEFEKRSDCGFGWTLGRYLKYPNYKQKK